MSKKSKRNNEKRRDGLPVPGLSDEVMEAMMAHRLARDALLGSMSEVDRMKADAFTQAPAARRAGIVRVASGAHRHLQVCLMVLDDPRMTALISGMVAGTGLQVEFESLLDRAAEKVEADYAKSTREDIC